MIVRFLRAARMDAVEAADWYDQQTYGLGDQFLAAVVDLTKTLESQPRLFGRVSHASLGREVRQAIISPFDYLLSYEVNIDEVLVLCVTHARRRRQPWHQRLP